MKGLIIKDFKLMKIQKNFFFVIIAISVFMVITSKDPSFSIGFLGFSGSLFTLSSISYDEFDNGNAFLFCLPVTRSSYVMEKYSFGLLTGGSSWLLGTVIGLFSSFGKNNISQVFMTALLVLPVIIFMLSVMLPFQLKFGGEKGRVAIIGAVGILASLEVIITKTAKLLHIDLAARFSNLPAPGMGMTAAAAILASLLLMLVSVKISISIMNKKEF